jgi:hypothetical protein
MTLSLAPGLLIVVAYLRVPGNGMDGFVFRQRLQATRRVWSSRGGVQRLERAGLVWRAVLMLT